MNTELLIERETCLTQPVKEQEQPEPPKLTARILGGWCLNTLLNLFSFRPRHLAVKSLHQLTNIRGTHNTIKLWERLFVNPPALLVDVGANCSQWAIWLKRQWFKMRVISFEPNRKYQPIGELYRYALGDHESKVDFMEAGAGSQVLGDNAGGCVELRRFDNLGIAIPPYSLLKVDTENSTYATLCGFGPQLSEFRMVIVEVWNDYGNTTQMPVFQLMQDRGFNRMQMVDYAIGLNGLMHIDVAFWKE